MYRVTLRPVIDNLRLKSACFFFLVVNLNADNPASSTYLC